MRRAAFNPVNRLRGVILCTAAAFAAVAFSSAPADARYHRLHARYVRHATAAPHAIRTYRRGHGEGYAPPTSAIVVDGNTGEVLYTSNADALRHPASLTKIMTLYLLFERLEAGKIRLDTPLRISEHAAEQAPTKLGLRPGQTLAVDDAIKAVVTKSANDAAVAIAENLGGDEVGFAKLMTEKAHALGMRKTVYVNASGLPDDDQNTTAQDQALLGRAIQERFPRYYKYFSTEQFVYHGHAMRNHNHLLGVVGGVDGIKTGYTRASGFNLVTSVHRDGRFIIAVVLGGRSAFERDTRMRELINAHIREASLRHTAPAIAENTEAKAPAAADKAATHPEQRPMAFAKTPLSSHTEPTPAAAARNGNAANGNNDPIQPLLVKTITYRTASTPTAQLGPMPALVPAPSALPLPLPQLPHPAQSVAAAQTSAQPPAAPTPVAQAQSAPATAPPGTATTPAPPTAPAAGAPNTVIVASVEPAPIASPPKVEPSKSEQSNAAPLKSEPSRPEPAKLELRTTDTRPETPKIDSKAVSSHPRARGGWVVQIGAFEDEDEAKQHLSAAQLKIPNLLAAADPFTERVQKGDKSLYRARFAGFDKAQAETVCKQLRRNDIACMTVKN